MNKNSVRYVNKYTQNGVIGKSGIWYPCEFKEHQDTIEANLHDKPFVACKLGYFADYYNYPPNYAQYKTVLEWCTYLGKPIEMIAVGTEWVKWIKGERGMSNTSNHVEFDSQGNPIEQNY